MRRNDTTQSCGGVLLCTNERGVALIIVLVMLLLLSILGASMLSSTTSDLKIAGNYRNSTEAFYTAEAAMAFAQTYDQIYLSILPGTNSWPNGGGGFLTSSFTPTTTNPAPLKPDGTAIPAVPGYNRIAIPGTKDAADVQVAQVGTGKLPAGLGTQEDAGLSPGTSFKANSFVINVIAYGQNGATAQVEAQMARVVPQ